jgi:hypothetical protein
VTTQAVLRQKRFRYWSLATRILYSTTSVAFLVPGILLIRVGIISPGSAQSFGGPFAIGLGVFFALSGLAFAAPASRPVLVLTAHTLRRPRLLRRAQIIPLEEVTGIGLVYKCATGEPAPMGWFLYLWTTGDIPRDLGIAYQRAFWLFPASKVRQKFLAIEPPAAELGRPFDRYRFGFRFDPVTQTDPAKIAATYAGRVAREIYDRVLAYQGPSGLLAIRQDQKHVPVTEAYFAGPTSAFPLNRWTYWSPDGELGRATTMPRPYRSAPPRKRPPRPRRPSPMRQLQYRLRVVGSKSRGRRGGVRHEMLP